MKYKHILITGGAGFIGSHLTDYLISKGVRVRVLDSLHPQIHPDGKIPSYFNPKAEFMKGDVTQRNDWRKALEGIDAVVHFAAAVGVGQSMYEIERYVRDNSLGTAIFLDILANEKHTIKKMLIAASMSSYGEGLYTCPKCKQTQQPNLRKIQNLKNKIWDPLCAFCDTELKAIPTPEEVYLKGSSVYAITKKNQEDLIMSVGLAYKIPAVSLRYFNVYGPRQSLSNPYTGVTAIFVSRVKNNNAPLINEDGLQTRDFIHVSDVVRAVDMSLIDNRANYSIYNVGSGIPITIKHVAQVVINYFKSTVKPKVGGKFRNVDVRHCYADIQKIKKAIGWKPIIAFDRGIVEVFEWSKDENAIDMVDQAMKELTTRGLN